jgi:hypothetical protein
MFSNRRKTIQFLLAALSREPAGRVFALKRPAGL